MERLEDIFGYFAFYDDYYHTEDQWFGRVIVNEDRTFEGIATDYYENENYYIFGSHINDKLVLYRFQLDDTTRFAHKYTCGKAGKKFYGTTFVTDSFIEIPIGDCKVAFMDAEKTREVTEAEIEKVKDYIESYKDSLNDNQKALYNSLHNGEHEQNVERSFQKIFLTK